MKGQSCRASGCFKPAVRKGMCAAHYQRQYRAARAQRAAAAARENAVCATRGCSRPLGKGSGRGFCHACIQKQWTEERRLGGVEKSRTEALKEFWALARAEALPLEVAAHYAGLQLTDDLVAELLAEAKKRRINLANHRYHYDVMLAEDFGEDPLPYERAKYVEGVEGPQPRQYRVEPKVPA